MGNPNRLLPLHLLLLLLPGLLLLQSPYSHSCGQLPLLLLHPLPLPLLPLPMQLLLLHPLPLLLPRLLLLQSLYSHSCGQLPLLLLHLLALLLPEPLLRGPLLLQSLYSRTCDQLPLFLLHLLPLLLLPEPMILQSLYLSGELPPRPMSPLRQDGLGLGRGEREGTS